MNFRKMAEEALIGLSHQTSSQEKIKYMALELEMAFIQGERKQLKEHMDSIKPEEA